MKTAFTPLPDIYANYINRTRPHRMATQHYHDKYEIYFQISGERKIFINDKVWTLGAGTVICVKPFDFHYAVSGENPLHERYVLNFSPNVFDNILSEEEAAVLMSVFDKCALLLDEEHSALLLQKYQKIEHELNSDTPLSRKLVKIFIIDMLYFLNSIPSNEKEEEHSSSYNLVRSAIQFINENFTRPISVDETAAHIHISKYHFCRIFKEVTGSTFLNYINMVRLRHAYTLLVTSDMSLTEIALASGFSSGAHFTRIFSSVYNMTPREFKKTIDF